MNGFDDSEKQKLVKLLNAIWPMRFQESGVACLSELNTC